MNPVPPENSVRVALQGLTRFALRESIDYDAASQNPNCGVAMGVMGVIIIVLRAFLLPRNVLAAENLALRQQLVVMQRTVKRAKLLNRAARTAQP